jgi:hypothetical protein
VGRHETPGLSALTLLWAGIRRMSNGSRHSQPSSTI